MDINDEKSRANTTPELRAEALSMVRSAMAKSGQKLVDVAKALGISKETLDISIKEESERLSVERRELKAKAMSLVKSGRTSAQVARTLKTSKWEVDYFIKETADAEVREKEKEAREAPEFRAKAICLVKSGRTTAQVARTLKAPRWHVDALIKDAMDAESREKAASATPEFRAKAVSLVESGQDTAEVAKTLGISNQTLDILIRETETEKAAIFAKEVINRIDAREEEKKRRLANRVAQERTSETLQMRENTVTCPKCHGTEWKLASLVHHEGIQSINSVSSSLGAGITTGGIGVGIASSNTTGVQQTTLSQLAAPPRVPDSNLDFFLFMLMVACGFLGIVFFIDGISNLEITEILTGCVFLSVTPFLFRKWSRMTLKESVQHQKEISKWRETKMCTRCGHFYN